MIKEVHKDKNLCTFFVAFSQIIRNFDALKQQTIKPNVIFLKIKTSKTFIFV